MLPRIVFFVPSYDFILIKIARGCLKIPIEFQNRLSEHINYFGHNSIMSRNSFWNFYFHRYHGSIIVIQLYKVIFEVPIEWLDSNWILVHFSLFKYIWVLWVHLNVNGPGSKWTVREGRNWSRRMKVDGGVCNWIDLRKPYKCTIREILRYEILKWTIHWTVFL